MGEWHRAAPRRNRSPNKRPERAPVSSHPPAHPNHRGRDHRTLPGALRQGLAWFRSNNGRSFLAVACRLFERFGGTPSAVAYTLRSFDSKTFVWSFQNQKLQLDVWCSRKLQGPGRRKCLRTMTSVYIPLLLAWKN